MGEFDDSELPKPNEWEEVLRKNDYEVKKWIDKHLEGRSCTIVLIGEKTASRKWVKYEIKRSWDLGKGVIGIYIHNLEDQDGNKSKKGTSPFGELKGVPEYDPCGPSVYQTIKDNIGQWVEEGIKYRTACDVVKKYYQQRV